MFYSSDGKNVTISTANIDIPGPQFCFDIYLPRKSTGQKYKIEECQHTFIHIGFIQKRSNDEMADSISECTKCKLQKFNTIIK